MTADFLNQLIGLRCQLSDLIDAGCKEYERKRPPHAEPEPAPVVPPLDPAGVTLPPPDFAAPFPPAFLQQPVAEEFAGPFPLAEPVQFVSADLPPVSAPNTTDYSDPLPASQTGVVVYEGCESGQHGVIKYA